MDKSYCGEQRVRDRGATGKTPVFEILKSDGNGYDHCRIFYLKNEFARGKNHVNGTKSF